MTFPKGPLDEDDVWVLQQYFTGTIITNGRIRYEFRTIIHAEWIGDRLRKLTRLGILKRHRKSTSKFYVNDSGKVYTNNHTSVRYTVRQRKLAYDYIKAWQFNYAIGDLQRGLRNTKL